VRYIDFESIISVPRMLRYKTACGNDSKKAMTLYRLNLRLSQELFTIISCFEISLRNAIDKHYTVIHGPDWLRDSSQPAGQDGRFHRSFDLTLGAEIQQAGLRSKDDGCLADRRLRKSLPAGKEYQHGKQE
jgi:hypothetical protein